MPVLSSDSRAVAEPSNSAQLRQPRAGGRRFRPAAQGRRTRSRRPRHQPSTFLMLLDLMARGLRRDGVTEFASMSGRPPCVKIDGAFRPLAEYAVSDDELLELLVTLGGF